MFGDIISNAFSWLLEKLIELVLYPFKLLIELVAWIIDLIPVPAFLHNVQSYINSVPSDLWWWGDLFNLPFGFSVCISAALAKFVIRRLPIIG